MTAPPPGGGSDPRVGGALLSVFNPTSRETQSIALKAAHWTGLGNPSGAKGYKYRDKDLIDGPCKMVLLKAGKLKAVCRGAGITYSLDEPTQGSLAAAFFGGGTEGVGYCLEFGGPAVLKDTPATNGGTGQFKAKDAPATCAVP